MSGVLFCDSKVCFSNLSNRNNTENWYQGLTFLKGDLGDSDFSNLTNIQQLVLWDVNLKNICFANNEEFTLIENTYSKVVYVIDSNVVCWVPYHADAVIETLPFVHTLDGFCKEIITGFANTGLCSEMADLRVEEELIATREYLKLRSQNSL